MLELGAHSLARRCRAHELRKGSNGGPPCFEQPSSPLTVYSTVIEVVKQIGTEVVVVSPDSHPEGEVHNSHLSQCRYVCVDKGKPRDPFISASPVLHECPTLCQVSC